MWPCDVAAQPDAGFLSRSMPISRVSTVRKPQNILWQINLPEQTTVARAWCGRALVCADNACVLMSPLSYITPLSAVICDLLSSLCCRCLSSVASGSNVTVTCSKAANATWPATGFVVNVTASPVGVPGCTDTRAVQTTMSVTTPTAVTLIGPVDPASMVVCPSVTSRVRKYTFSTLPAGGGLSNVTLTSSGPSCSVASPTNREWGGGHA